MAIPYQAEVPLPIIFKGRPLQTIYRADVICYREIIVELKALRALGPAEEGQVLNYLKASGLQRALLINFGGRRLEIRRFVGPDAPFSVSSVSSADSVVDLPSIPAPKV
jgi:GxxExxY protein